MELPAVGEHVFAVESIEKKRIRKVGRRGGGGEAAGSGGRRGPREGGEGVGRLRAEPGIPRKLMECCLFPPQGRVEYLVKWRGWSPK